MLIGGRPVGTEANGRRLALQPVGSPERWVIWGLILQVLSMGSVAVVMWRNIRNQGIGRHITAEMIKLAWHGELHTRSGLIVLITGSVVYAVGSVLMARPYLSSRVGLFVAIPIAALVGILVLGVLVLVIAFLFLLLEDMLAGDPATVSRSRVTGPADTEPENEPPQGQPDRRA
jgi:hypothetical protein